MNDDYIKLGHRYVHKYMKDFPNMDQLCNTHFKSAIYASQIRAASKIENI